MADDLERVRHLIALATAESATINERQNAALAAVNLIRKKSLVLMTQAEATVLMKGVGHGDVFREVADVLRGTTRNAYARTVRPEERTTKVRPINTEESYYKLHETARIACETPGEMGVIFGNEDEEDMLWIPKKEIHTGATRVAYVETIRYVRLVIGFRWASSVGLVGKRRGEIVDASAV